MFTVTDLAGWLTGLGLDPTIPVLNGVYIPPVPHRVVLAQMVGGPGLSAEEGLDSLTVQIRARGNPYPADPAAADDDAGQLAWTVDTLILATVPPFTIGATRIQIRDRLGAPPRFQLFDTAMRAEWVCQYTLTAARILT